MTFFAIPYCAQSVAGPQQGLTHPDYRENCDNRDSLLTRAYKLELEIGQPDRSKVLITDRISDFFGDLKDDLRDNPQNATRKFSAEFFVERFNEFDVQITSKIRNDLRYSGAALTKSDFLAEKLFSIVEDVSSIACEGRLSNCSPFSIKFSLDESGFSAEAKFDFAKGSTVNASRFAEAYNLENRYEGCPKIQKESGVVYNFTRARSENYQVIYRYSGTPSRARAIDSKEVATVTADGSLQ